MKQNNTSLFFTLIPFLLFLGTLFFLGERFFSKKNIIVPSFSGISCARTFCWAKETGIFLAITRCIHDPTYPPYTVIAQSPAAGTAIAAQGTLSLVISLPLETPLHFSLVGLARDEGVRLAEKEGIIVTASTIPSSLHTPETIIALEEKEIMAQKTPRTMYIATAPQERCIMGNLYGKSTETVQSFFESSGYQVIVHREKEDGEASRKTTITTQHPRAGEPLERSMVIHLWESTP